MNAKERLERLNGQVKTIFLDACYTNEGWYIHQLTDKYSISSRVCGNKTKVFKMISIIEDCQPEHLFNYIIDSSKRQVWDSVCVLNENVCRIGETGCVVQLAVKLPLPCEMRDSVMLRCWEHDKDGFAIYETSIGHKKVPICKKYVRAHVYLSGFQVLKNENNAVLTFLLNTKYNGFIPSFFQHINTTSAIYNFVVKLISEFKIFSKNELYCDEAVYASPDVFLKGIPTLDISDIEEYSLSDKYFEDLVTSLSYSNKKDNDTLISPPS